MTVAPGVLVAYDSSYWPDRFVFAPWRSAQALLSVPASAGAVNT